MASRDVFTSSTPGPVSGDDYMDNLAGHIGRLYDASVLPLTGVAGTGDAITATLDPPLAAGLVTGMKFSFTAGAANTGGVTISLNGGTALPVVDATGAALIAGALTAGLRVMLEYVAGSFRVLGGSAGGSAGDARYFWAFTTSGTWTKPAGLDDDTMVFIEAWGGGGSGYNSAGAGGGGGGGYSAIRLRIADIPPSVAVAIGAGGVVPASGGNTTFGSLLIAYGGGRASGSTGTSHSAGGGGGGSLGAGAVGGIGAGVGGAGGIPDGAPGASGTSATQTNPNATGYGGGGGGREGANAGHAVYGGGGGAGWGGSTQGLSKYGGAGGASGSSGNAPGGGGGWNAPGARGEVRIWI